MTPPPEHPGAAIRRRLDHLNVTVETLATTIGRAPNHVARLIRGEHALTVTTALLIAKALGMDAVELRQQQMAFDVDRVVRRDAAALARIRPLV